MTLTDLLRDEIASRGPIPFRDFMERALYDPEHGYYASARARIGRVGDFFTNVSVGPLFGALLARQFGEMWERLGRPDDFTIVEQGAHDGRLASDVLGALRSFNPLLHQRLSYLIVEPCSDAQAVQRAALELFGDCAKWVVSVAELPSFTGVHFSNELIDAFPVHLVKRVAGEWRERYVDWQDEAFAFVDGRSSTPELQPRLAVLPDLPDGYETEVNLAAGDWIGAVAERLERGFVLAIDYGFSRDEYYRPERANGSLSAYRAHRRESNPLARPGEIDLTAHVDFTSLAEAAKTARLRLAGFTDQHHFLVGLSPLHFDDTPPPPADLRAFKTLMHPELMGRAFKAICFSRDTPAEPLAGFQFAGDSRAALGL